MLEKVKAALRIKSSVFDEEVGGVIAAALADLKRVGVAVPEWPATGESDPPAVDPLIMRAVILYAKGNFGYSDESEKYQQAYENLKCGLSLTDEYQKKSRLMMAESILRGREPDAME